MGYLRGAKGSIRRIEQLNQVITGGQITPDEFVKLVGKVTQSDLRGLIISGFIGRLLKGDIGWEWLSITELEGCYFNRRMGDTLFEITDVWGIQDYPMDCKGILIGSFVDFLLMNRQIKRDRVIQLFGGVPDIVDVTYQEYRALQQRGQEDCFGRVEFVNDQLHMTNYVNGKRNTMDDALIFQKEVLADEWVKTVTQIRWQW